MPSAWPPRAWPGRDRGGRGPAPVSDILPPIEPLRPPTVEFGPGTAASVGRRAEARGLRRALVFASA